MYASPSLCPMSLPLPDVLTDNVDEWTKWVAADLEKGGGGSDTTIIKRARFNEE